MRALAFIRPLSFNASNTKATSLFEDNVHHRVPISVLRLEVLLAKSAILKGQRYILLWRQPLPPKPVAPLQQPQPYHNYLILSPGS